VETVTRSLEEQIHNLPAGPGVYLMKGGADAVLYVGKAKNLRGRVRTYFDRSADARYSLKFLVPKIHRVETILTDTEQEALILENTLIKKHKPRYNINLKDDKTFFSLRLDPREDFPRFTLVRKVKKDGARYFGPFSSSAAVKETLNVLHRVFPLRTCREANFHNRARPCLNYQIRKCPGPCCGFVTRESYANWVQEAALFLEGKNTPLRKLLRERMQAASRDLNFEEAARIRDQISAVERTLEKQKAVHHHRPDRDVFAFHRQGNEWEFQILFFRRGLLVGSRSFHFSRLNLPDGEALAAFVRQYYAGEPALPREILLPLAVEDREVIEGWLSEKKGATVVILSPQRGDKKDLVEMARKNAEDAFRKRLTEKENLELVLQELQTRLRLKRPPRRIECFDISDLLGTLAVGSRVVFQDGKTEKSAYRHFKIRAPSFPDDYAMMYEILKRRFGKIPAGDPAPDLLVVDGGKGQLGVALAVLAELGLKEIPAVGLAKEKGDGTKIPGGRSADKIYLPGVKDPLLLPGHSASLRYLQRIRDEAHRFALAFHKKLRGKRGLQTVLDEIPGIGAVKKKALLGHFGSPAKIREASAEDLRGVEHLNEKDAQTVHDFFHPKPMELADADFKTAGREAPRA
jgi:excinuclease ABC subunit C